MKAIKLFQTILPLMLASVFVSAVSAQDAVPIRQEAPPDQRPAPNQPQDVRNNVLRQLGLSREQIQQIRRHNADRKPLMDDAQKRFRQANHALDEAIYADQVDETEVNARLKEVQFAQAEVARIRFMNELAVRKILTPEQLLRFRELRRRFEQIRQNMENRPQANEGRRVNDLGPNSNVRSLQEKRQPIRQIFRQPQQKPNFE